MIENLRLPASNNDGFNRVVNIRNTALERLLNVGWTAKFRTEVNKLQSGLQTTVRQTEVARLQTEFKTQADLMALWSQIRQTLEGGQEREQEKKLRELAQADRPTLKSALADPNPMYRLTAVEAIGRHRLHMEENLIACLTDAQPLIRSAARQALVRLARGTDFGPPLAASNLEQRRAVQRWKTWLAGQDDSDRETVAVALLNPDEAEAMRLAVELVQARKDQEDDLLKRLRTVAGPQGTLALAAASAEANGPRRIKYRQALAQRLAEQDPHEWKPCFADRDPEIRRAVLVAAGMKKAEQFIPDALKLLEDADSGICQTARSTLTLLTRQDFGPAANATALDRSIAIGSWYRWWLKRN